MRSIAALVLWAALLAGHAARAEDGEALYQRCLTCHQPGGEGIPGIFPPLKNRMADIVSSAEGRAYVTMVLTSGLVGTVEIDGQRYVGAMPAQGLSDEEAAEVINYVVTAFAGPGAADGAEPFTGAEVEAIRAANSGDGSQPALSLRSRVPALNR
jgi:mono/diheme cytochrome c family protein